MLKPDAILETALYVSDINAAHAFYGGILNLEEILHVPGRHRFYGCGPGMLLLFVAEATRVASGPFPVPTHGADGPGHMCFRVSRDALDAWRSHLEDNGLEIEADFEWPTGARSIYIRDPDQNSIEFSEPLLWNRPLP
ncbi:MAG: VOC family protein [Rhodobacteraceae bacterium]|nr:VOC family protein [Paracoccaceae bacterium]